MVAKAFTFLTLAIVAAASPIQQSIDRSLVHAVIDTPSGVNEYVTLARRQDDGTEEAVPKKSSKGKAKGKAKSSSPKGSASSEDAPASKPKSSGGAKESEGTETPAPKATSSGSSKGSGGTSKGIGGLGSLGGSSSSSSGSSGGGLLDAIPFGTSLSSMGMMSSSDLKKGSYECKKVALLFARGTGEPGNMGFVVGPPLGTQLKKQYGNDILIQGMDYTTDFSGSGAKEMAKYAKDLLSKCPNTKIVLSGYSQGAMQVHQALGTLGPDASKIAAAVTFGDPYSTMGWGSGGIVGSVMGLGSLTSGSKSSGGSSGSSGSSSPKPASTGGGSFDGNNGLILCSTGDFVCGVVPSFGAGSGKSETGGKGGVGHISYSSDGSIGKATSFITKKINGS